MRKSSAVIIMVTLTVIATGVFVHLNTAAAASKQILNVVKVAQGPSGLTDPSWDEATSIEIPFEGKEKFADKKTSVSTKALYTSEEIYFLFEWKDSTLSVTKGAWTYDGQSWSHQEGNEDRISLMFEIDRIKNFATKGCAVVCHVPAGAPNAKEGKFGTKTAAEKGDLWHWKAARSDPAGFADDTWVTQISEKKGGRKSDAGEGGDKKNITEDKSKPMFMLGPGKKLGKNNILMATDAVEIPDDAMFKSGDTLTYRMPKMPKGSRADIKSMSQYSDGTWTVMLYRKLDTGNDDDVPFNTRKNYNFAMALFDDSGDEDSYDSEVLTLSFKR